MTRHTFVSPPSISLGDDVRITTRPGGAEPDRLIVGLWTGRHDLVGDLYLSTDAAVLLRDKLTAALVDAPGTSSPQREPGDAA